MGLIDVKPLGDVEKYLQLGVVAFVSFFGTWSTVGLYQLAATGSITVALTWGFLTACGTMSTIVLATARASKLFTKVKDVLPTEGPQVTKEWEGVHLP